MNDQSVVGRILSDAVSIFLLLLFLRFLIDLFLSLSRSRPPPGLIPVLEVVYSLTDPPLKFLRRFIPPLRVGSVSLDLSFLVLVVGLVAIQSTVLARI